MSCARCRHNTPRGCSQPDAQAAAIAGRRTGAGLGVRILEWAARQPLDADGMPAREGEPCPGVGGAA